MTNFNERVDEFNVARNALKPCRLSFEGVRYQVNANGSVWNIQVVPPQTMDELTASKVKSEAKRLRRNRSQRERNQAMRDLGLVKTPYGWE